MLRALSIRNERMLVTVSTNVAVDNIFARCARVYKAFNRIKENAAMPLTRLFSQSQIKAQYLVKDPILEHSCHIEVKKLALITK